MNDRERNRIEEAAAEALAEAEEVAFEAICCFLDEIIEARGGVALATWEGMRQPPRIRGVDAERQSATEGSDAATASAVVAVRFMPSDPMVAPGRAPDGYAVIPPPSDDDHA